MNIVLVDKNKKLITKVRRAVKYLPFKVEAINGDITDFILNVDNVICSASNPNFTFGGGVDAAIAPFFRREIKRLKKGKNQRTDSLMALITVDDKFQSSRGLVAEALKFAFANTRIDETLVLTGLGTSTGGLDEDDFVWLFVSALCEAFGYGWGIKFTQKNGTDWKTGKVEYKVGKWLEQSGAKVSDEDCGVGLHLGKDFVGAGNYSLPEKIFFCLYEKKDICNVSSDKVRLKRLLPLYECSRWLGYGKNGKKILAKIDKKFNLEKYNPYQATKLPTKEVLKSLLPKVRDQVGNQVWDQVWDQVGYQVWDQFRYQVGYQVWDQVGNQVWDQVWDQVWATSYWAINDHFSLGVVHPFFDFLKLGVMAIFINGKIKIFGKKGKYLGEYDDSEIFDK